MATVSVHIVPVHDVYYIKYTSKLVDWSIIRAGTINLKGLQRSFVRFPIYASKPKLML